MSTDKTPTPAEPAVATMIEFMDMLCKGVFYGDQIPVGQAILAHLLPWNRAAGQASRARRTSVADAQEGTPAAPMAARRGAAPRH